MLFGRSEGPLPKNLLGLNVEAARQIVENQQLRVSNEHPRGGGPSLLSPGELHPARPHNGVQSLFKGCNVRF